MCFKIISQNRQIVSMNRSVHIVCKSLDTYTKPYWIVDADDFVLGKYEDFDTAKKIILDIYNSKDDKYKMPGGVKLKKLDDILSNEVLENES